MIKKTKTPLPKYARKENIEQREKDIKQVYDFEIGENGIFETINYNAWKAAFNRYAKNYLPKSNKMFTFRHKEDNYYQVWRIK